MNYEIINKKSAGLGHKHFASIGLKSDNYDDGCNYMAFLYEMPNRIYVSVAKYHYNDKGRITKTEKAKILSFKASKKDVTEWVNNPENHYEILINAYFN